MFLISLDWKKPSDGVEIVPAMEALPKLLTDDDFIRGKSGRTTPISIRVTDLEAPVSIRLLNAKTKDELASFVSRFGVLHRLGYHHDHEGEFMRMLESVRDDLEEGFELTNSGDDTARAFGQRNTLARRLCIPRLNTRRKIVVSASF